MWKFRRAGDNSSNIDSKQDGPFLLAILYTFGFFGVVFSVLLNGVPENAKDTINQLIPILSAIQLGIVQFFYNKNMREKSDEAINKVMDKVAQMPAMPSKAENVDITAQSATLTEAPESEKK